MTQVSAIYGYYNIIFRVRKVGKLNAVKLFALGILMSKGGDSMQLRSLAITMGLGAAAGAVAVLMMPKSNPTRKLAEKAAEKVEDTAVQLTNKIASEMDM